MCIHLCVCIYIHTYITHTHTIKKDSRAKMRVIFDSQWSSPKSSSAKRSTSNRIKNKHTLSSISNQLKTKKQHKEGTCAKYNIGNKVYSISNKSIT